MLRRLGRVGHTGAGMSRPVNPELVSNSGSQLVPAWVQEAQMGTHGR